MEPGTLMSVVSTQMNNLSQETGCSTNQKKGVEKVTELTSRMAACQATAQTTHETFRALKVKEDVPQGCESEISIKEHDKTKEAHPESPSEPIPSAYVYFLPMDRTPELHEHDFLLQHSSSREDMPAADHGDLQG